MLWLIASTGSSEEVPSGAVESKDSQADSQGQPEVDQSHSEADKSTGL